MKPLRVAIVGCGFMGRMHANVYGQLEGSQLCAVVDHKQAHLDQFTEEFGVPGYLDFDAMLAAENPDAVDICLPTYLHKEFTVRSAAAGKHVMCEKPMALNLEEADAMISACEKAGVVLMIGHCIRFWPEYALLKKITVEGRLGKLLSLNLTRLGEFPSWSSDNWLAEESKSGGGVQDMHIHDSDFALYLMGQPKSVAAYGNVNKTGPAFAFTTLDYGHSVAHLEGGWNLPKGTPFKMTFRAIFENGVAYWENGPMTIIEQGKPPEIPEFPKMKAAGGGNISDLGGYYHELRYFVEHVTSGEPLKTVTPQTSRESLALVLEEIKQIKTKAGN